MTPEYSDQLSHGQNGPSLILKKIEISFKSGPRSFKQESPVDGADVGKLLAMQLSMFLMFSLDLLRIPCNVFGRIHLAPAPPRFAPSLCHPTVCPPLFFKKQKNLFTQVRFVRPVHSRMCVFCWSVASLPGAALVEKTDSHSPSICQLPTVPWLGVGLPVHLSCPCWNLLWLVAACS